MSGRPEGYFERIVERSADAVLVLGPDLRIRYASPAAHALAGTSDGMDVGGDPLRFVHPEDVPVLLALAGDQMGGAAYVLPIRFRIVRPDGDVRTVEAVSVDLDDGPDAGGLLVQLRDVTLADAVTPAAYRHERRFQRMLEHVADAVVLLDASGRIITASGLAREVLGGPGDRIDLDVVTERCHPDDHERLRLHAAALMGGSASRFVGDLTFRADDGSWRTVEVRGFDYLDDPVIGAVVVIGRDVTAERAAEEAKAEAHRQVLRSLDQRREFVATVSHELRTPIHGILGVAELLADPRRSSDPVELAGLISRSAESLLEVVDDMLDLSRLEIGRLELGSGPVDVAGLAEEVASLFRPTATEAGLSLTVSVGDGVPASVRSDALRVRQILSNLLSNAVKFTERGGISVQVERVRGSGDRVRVSVTDTGPGIAAEGMTDLFEPFAQVHGSDALRARGSGLGLAISRRLAEAMGGELGVESELGQGSTFWMSLPVVAGAHLDRPASEPDRPAARARGTTPTVESAAAPRPVVLVVEDDPTSGFLVEHQLARLGYDAEVVTEGEAVVEAWRRVHPVAVLMDDRLPGIDGREATRRLRAAEATSPSPAARVPVISVTASASAADLTPAETGIDEVLTKPVRLAALGGALDRLLVR